MREYEINDFDAAGDLSQSYCVWCADISVFSATLAASHADCAVFARQKAPEAQSPMALESAAA
jgi:hypothetical protein